MSSGRALVVFDDVWKKFSRAPRFNSLRDIVPAMASRIFRRERVQQTTLEEQEFWALQGVSFEVKAGQALGIIGPNGAGKSTALKILTGLLRPERGFSEVNGRIGALVEVAAGFHPDLTGRENVFMQGAIMGMKRAEVHAKFDDIVDFAGVSEFIDTPVKRYSSGMNARLGFSVAAHLDPDVLIIDEVLSVGDIAFQERCYQRMQSFIRSGIAVVFVSHNLSAISSLCERVLVLKHGTPQALAPTLEAIGVYARLAGSARPAGAGRSDMTLRVTDATGSDVREVRAGQHLHVRATAYPRSGVRFKSELHIRHLESGSMVYRCESLALGTVLTRGGDAGGLEIEWRLDANLARGHYSFGCDVLDEHHNWVAVSAPVVLTVNESESQSGTAYLRVHCSMAPANGDLPEAVPLDVA